MIYQVAWTKSLALLFGFTTYAVATVLAVFRGGLDFGSAWHGERSEAYSNAFALYGWLELGVVLSMGVAVRMQSNLLPWPSRMPITISL